MQRRKLLQQFLIRLKQSHAKQIILIHRSPTGFHISDSYIYIILCIFQMMDGYIAIVAGTTFPVGREHLLVHRP
jgi:hypothetical protein